jgi:phosphohistidine phosphatase
MRLLVIRHGRAAAPRQGVPDDERALTPDGERLFARCARGIARLVPKPDALVASPLLRARQTATLLAAAWGGVDVELDAVLAAGGVDAILASLENHPPEATVVLVGHEPTVSALVAELVSARGEAMAFEPGAAALIEVASLARRAGRLIWFLPPEASAGGG